MDDLDLGIRFVIEPSSTSLSSEERELLHELRPSGVMFRKRNFMQDAPYLEWCSAFNELLTDIRKTIGRDNLFVSVDHEGGRVHRFPPPITRFPFPAFYASSLPAVDAVSRAMAVELRSLGFNLSFSPVADIHSNPSNPVINQRAFGRTADEVAERTIHFAQGLREEGILPCAKHFPGHGDTAVDSHYDLPVVNGELVELRYREFLPFKCLIEDGIEMVMSAHIVLPKVDPGTQATLSRKIMTDILRGELGFTGVIIADALGMKAIRGEMQSELFAAQAHNAGIDLFLVAGDPVSISDALACKRFLQASYSRGDISLPSLQSSEKRITTLLSSMPSYPVAPLPQKILQAHRALSDRLSRNAEWQEFALNLIGFD